MRHPVPLLVIVAFVTALFWAKARDPFRRTEFSVRTVSGIKVNGMAVLPKTADSFPVAIYLQGSGGSLMNSGADLRLIAEQGMAAVGLEYNQTNQAAFDEEFIALHQYLAKQKWARAEGAGAKGQVSGDGFYRSISQAQPSTHFTAWIGCSLGAQRQLSFLLRHPEFAPQLAVRLSGGWVGELEGSEGSQKGEASGTASQLPGLRPQLSGTRFLLVHGENDEVFPVADCRRMADLFRANGVAVDLRVFPGQPHDFGSDRPVMVRGVAEYCAAFLDPHRSKDQAFDSSPLRPLRLNSRPWLLHYWLPFGLLTGWVLIRQYLRWRKLVSGIPRGKLGVAVLCAAWVLGIAALGETVVRLGLPCFSVSEGRLGLTRHWLVRPHLLSDFDWLAGQPVWTGQPIGALLEHLELADYNRGLVNWQVEEEAYRHFVLSPLIEERRRSGEEPLPPLNWRRPLWENFYPRIPGFRAQNG